MKTIVTLTLQARNEGLSIEELRPRIKTMIQAMKNTGQQVERIQIVGNHPNFRGMIATSVTYRTPVDNRQLTIDRAMS